nr:immunoglobulin heavy chain junction region [Homo sapiens]
AELCDRRGHGRVLL